MNHAIDLSPLRSNFPALQETDDQGRPFVFFDGPAGTQVPQTVIDAVANHYASANSLAGGNFVVSRRCAAVVQEARQAMADFINAPSSQEIIFGPNMTSLTYSISRAIGQILQPGDEIIVTRLDHYANVSTWMALKERGIQIKQADFDVEDCQLDIDHLASLITSKTKLVAVGYASNMTGSINPISRIAALSHSVGAWLYVDAVHYAPHGPIDVQAIDCDFLVCSVYKFFGPHVGVLWGKYDLLDALPAYQVEPASPEIPGRFETGMLNFEGLAGTVAAINYLAEIGQLYGTPFADKVARYDGRRKLLKQGMNVISAYEAELMAYMISQMQTIPGLTIYGIVQPQDFARRCPTISFTLPNISPAEISAYLGEQNIFVWDGNNYALGVTQRLGIEEQGGAVRAGIAHYNTKNDIDRLITALKAL